MEASTISEWVARVLEELGHEVIVADPNYESARDSPAQLSRSCALTSRWSAVEPSSKLVRLHALSLLASADISYMAVL